MIRKMVLCVGLLAAVAGTGRAGFVTSFDQVQTWVGSGSNEAAFVVDWNNGEATESFVWGYRWNGTATGEDMFRALAGANVGLYGTVGYFGPGLGYALFGIGFDANRDGQFGVTPPLTFVAGVATENRDSEVVDDRLASTPGDFYSEGWWQGYWTFWVGEGPGEDPANPYADGTSDGWQYSGLGMSSRVLTNGSWQGWSFAAGFLDSKPDLPSNPLGDGEVVSTPEPGGLLLALSGVGMVIAYARRRRVTAGSETPAVAA